MRKILFAILALMGIVSCADKDQAKTLVLYYSQSGATETVAKEIAGQLGADVAAYDVVTPYDGTYDETIQRCLAERSSGEIPSLKPLDVDITGYDTVFLGYPVWFGTCAHPALALLKEVNLEGKTVVTFCTFGSGGLQSSTADVRVAQPTANVVEGYGVRNARVAAAPKEVEDFLKRAGFLEGEVEVLVDFSEQVELTEETQAIFDAACSSYPMPLGTPVSVASRPRTVGTEYLFTTQSVAEDGAAATFQIYVIAEDGKSPEFTQVVR